MEFILLLLNVVFYKFQLSGLLNTVQVTCLHIDTVLDPLLIEREGPYIHLE